MEKILTAQAKAWLQELPENFRATVAGITCELLTNYPDTLAGMVVGSLAEGVSDSFSDVDYLYVKDPMIPDDEIVKIKARWPLSHFIFHRPEKLEHHFTHCTTMAWSIKKGIVLFDRHNLLAPFRQRDLGMPSKEWMRSWMTEVDWWPEDPRGLRHKMLNLGILYLALLGVAPTTKHEISKEFRRRVTDKTLLKAMSVAAERGTDESEFSETQLQCLKQALGMLREELEATGL
ncbi:hypothetical protein ACFL34_03740 [Candidatus Sumerlaeota bacterium]